MIKIDLTTAVALYLLVVLGIVIWHYLKYTKKNKDVAKPNNDKDLVQCPVCAALFYDYSKEELKQCSQCLSYFYLEEQGKKRSANEAKK